MNSIVIGEKELLRQKFFYYKMDSMRTDQRQQTPKRTNRSIHLEKLNASVKKSTRFRSLDKAQDMKSISDEDDFIASIIEKDFMRLFNFCMKHLQECIRLQQPTKFIEILLFLSNEAIELKKIDTGVFLLWQALILTEIFSDKQNKINCLIGLAQACRITCQYSQALQLLNKALQYALASGNHTAEVILYDLIGLTFYYMGQIEKATIFHQKFIKAQVEPDDSYYRLVSIKYVHYTQKESQYHSDKFNKIVLIKLSLPLINIFDDDTQTSQISCDEFKSITAFNCSRSIIISKILDRKEYTLFNFNYDENQNSQSDSHNRPITLPKYIVKIKARLQHQPFGPEKRQSDLNQLYEKIRQHQKYPSQEQIFLRHLKITAMSKFYLNSIVTRKIVDFHEIMNRS